MLNIFTKEKAIDRQIEDFVTYKKRYSACKAAECFEYLKLFKEATHKDHAFEITEDDVVHYRKWLMGRYAGNYQVESGLKSLDGFLKFFRVRFR